MTRQNNIQRTFWVVLLIAVILAFILFFGGSRLAANYPISPVDMSTTANGTYLGEAELSPIRVKLEVTVKDEQITAIRILEHNNGIGYRAEEKVVQQIIEKQTNVVDTVTGATISSKVIMKAVSNALNP